MKNKKYKLILILVVILISGCNDVTYKITFSELETGTSASIRALHVVSNDIIWASGTGGTYLVSVDGGESWKVDTVPGASEDDFRSIHAWSDSEAIVFGINKPGRAFYTDDGGETWNIVYENNTDGIFFDSAVFADENTGLALSDPLDSISFLIRTSDRGRSWKKLNNMPVLKQGEYNFAASNSCIDYHAGGNIWIITGGSAARVFISNDHGLNWTARETGMVRGNPSSGIFSVSFYNDRNGIVVGGTYDKPELNYDIAAWSSDGGNSWHLSEIMPREYRSCVIWMQNKKTRIALAIGKTGCDYSLDKGRTWRPGSDVKDYYTARAVPGGISGFAAGSGGKIGRMMVEKVEKVE